MNRVSSWLKENWGGVVAVIFGIGTTTWVAVLGELSGVIRDYPHAAGLLSAAFFFLGYAAGQHMLREAKERRKRRAEIEEEAAEEDKQVRELLRRSDINVRYMVSVMLDDGELVMPDTYKNNSLFDDFLYHEIVEYETAVADRGYGEEAVRKWSLTEQGKSACKTNSDAIVRPPADIAEVLRCGYC